MKWFERFWNHHFVKHEIHFVQTGIIAVKYSQNGKKYLSLIKTEEGKKIWQQNFLVEHLLNENKEVTEQTLEQESML